MRLLAVSWCAGVGDYFAWNAADADYRGMGCEVSKMAAPCGVQQL